MSSASEEGERRPIPAIEAPAIKVIKNPAPCIRKVYARAPAFTILVEGQRVH